MKTYIVTFYDERIYLSRTNIINALKESVIKGVFKGKESWFNKSTKIYYEHGYIALVFDSRKTSLEGEDMWHRIIDTLNDELKELGMWQRFYPNREGYGYFQSSIRLMPDERK